MKQCTKCKQYKDKESSYSFRDIKNNIKHNICKECYKSTQKIHYKNNSQYYKDKSKNNATNFTPNVQDFLSIKEDLKCELCGESHPATLRIIPLNPNISKYKTLIELKNNIIDFKVICANCTVKTLWN